MSDVQLIVNGKSFSGWKSVDIQRSMEQLAGTFELSVSEVAPNGDAAKSIILGSRCTLKIDGKSIITGYIDDLDISHDITDHTITVRGRDAAADLVDCCPTFVTRQWNDQGMLAIVQELVADYDIKVSVNADLGKPFYVANIEPGETIFENIDKMARHRNVLVISDGLGGIMLTKPGTAQVSTMLRLGDNILSGRLSLSNKNRYKDYIVLSQEARNDFTFSIASTEPKGIAADSGIKRTRTSVLFYEEPSGDNKALADRAQWQRNINAAKAQRATYTVQGWKHADGLWHPNTLVSVTDERLRLNKAQLLIASVRFLLDYKGSRTELELTPRNSFLVDQLPQDLLE